jgi:ribosomal protein S18 acetylase RimI-like enzyme
MTRTWLNFECPRVYTGTNTPNVLLTILFIVYPAIVSVTQHRLQVAGGLYIKSNMSSSDPILQLDLPTPEEHNHLRTISGLTPIPLDPSSPEYSLSLSSSLACFTARDLTDQSLVGMARLIGDKHIFLQLVDVAVHPAHQGRGIGETLLKAVTRWIEANAAQAYVSCVADPKGQGLYRRHGFVATEGIGMKRGTWGR